MRKAVDIARHNSQPTKNIYPMTTNLTHKLDADYGVHQWTCTDRIMQKTLYFMGLPTHLRTPANGLMAEEEGLEPSEPYRVHGLAIRCITTLPPLRNRHKKACRAAVLAVGKWQVNGSTWQAGRPARFTLRDN
jgi:hypothetical protein